MSNQIDWNLVHVSYTIEDPNSPLYRMPIYYKEGCADSSVTLPTGADAAQLADGCLVRFTGGDKANEVHTYNKKTDSWGLMLALSS